MKNEGELDIRYETGVKLLHIKESIIRQIHDTDEVLKNTQSNTVIFPKDSKY